MSGHVSRGSAGEYQADERKEMRRGGADRQTAEAAGLPDHRNDGETGVGLKRRSCRVAGLPDHRHHGEMGGTDRQEQR